VVGVLVLAFVVSRGCQQSQVRVSEEQAIATAREQVEFTPRRTQIRLLRQGLNSKPNWIVSLSIPDADPDTDDVFRRLAVVRVNANTGEVLEVSVQGPRRE
jgi:Peptidase propeptide and YPEB domain